MFFVPSCSCLCPIHWSQVLSWEWRCSWSSANRRCSNYSWVSALHQLLGSNSVINNFIACRGATYITGLTVCARMHMAVWAISGYVWSGLCWVINIALLQVVIRQFISVYKKGRHVNCHLANGNVECYDIGGLVQKWPGGCFTNASRALQKILSNLCIAEIVLLMGISSWNFVRVPNVMLWAHVQSFSLKLSLTIYVISGIVYFHEIILESSRNISETPPWSSGPGVPENPMRPLWNFTWGSNGHTKFGVYVMFFYGGVLHNLFGALENSHREWHGLSKKKMSTEKPATFHSLWTLLFCCHIPMA